MRFLRCCLRGLAGAGLLYAGIVHLHLAARYDGGGLLIPRRWAWWPAIVVAGATALAVVASVYLSVGSIGPLPALPHEPWYAEKAVSAVAEAAVVILGGIAWGSGRRRRGRQRRPDSEQSKPFAANSA